MGVNGPRPVESPTAPRAPAPPKDRSFINRLMSLPKLVPGMFSKDYKPTAQQAPPMQQYELWFPRQQWDTSRARSSFVNSNGVTVGTVDEVEHVGPDRTITKMTFSLDPNREHHYKYRPVSIPKTTKAGTGEMMELIHTSEGVHVVTGLDDMHSIFYHDVPVNSYHSHTGTRVKGGPLKCKGNVVGIVSDVSVSPEAGKMRLTLRFNNSARKTWEKTIIECPLKGPSGNNMHMTMHDLIPCYDGDDWLLKKWGSAKKANTDEKTFQNQMYGTFPSVSDKDPGPPKHTSPSPTLTDLTVVQGNEWIDSSKAGSAAPGQMWYDTNVGRVMLRHADGSTVEVASNTLVNRSMSVASLDVKPLPTPTCIIVSYKPAVVIGGVNRPAEWQARPEGRLDPSASHEDPEEAAEMLRARPDHPYLEHLPHVVVGGPAGHNPVQVSTESPKSSRAARDIDV